MIAQNGREIMLLTSLPALQKLHRVLAELVEEGMPGLGMLQGLDNQAKLLVKTLDLPQSVHTFRAVQETGHLISKRFIDSDADIVHRGCRVGMEVFVHADSVRQLGRIQLGDMGVDPLRNLGEKDLISAEDLKSS